MSLINQVLKDLDQQRGPADGLQVAALKGIGLVQAKQTQWPAILTASAFGLTLAVTGFILFQFAGQWAEGEVENEPAPVVDTEPVTAITATPETLKTIAEAVVATPAPPLPVETATSITQSAIAFVADESHDVAAVAETPSQPIKTLSARQHAEHAFAAAQQAMSRHDKLAAEQLFSSALDYQPQHMDARIQLAAIFLERSDAVAAEQLLEEGLSLDPSHTQLARLYAQLLATRGEFDRALTALAGATDTQSPDAEILALRAAVYERIDNYEDAASSYRQALKLDPSQANWWMGLGLAREQQALYSSAVEAYQQADRLPLAENVRAFVRQRLERLQQIAGDK